MPDSTSVKFDKNFIDTAVCEFRFPTLLELERKLPVEFQKKLKKDYPNFEVQKERKDEDEERISTRYLFKSKNKKWTVSLRSSSIAIETSDYCDYEDFHKRAKKLLESCNDLLDTDFFTRVGLRYINSVPINDGEIKGWINKELIHSLEEGRFGYLNQYITALQGCTKFGKYSFKHGMNPFEGDHQKPISNYLLDFDYFDENVEASNALELMENFNNINFSFFYWCLGDKAKSELGVGTTKEQQG